MHTSQAVETLRHLLLQFFELFIWCKQNRRKKKHVAKSVKRETFQIWAEQHKVWSLS